MSAYNGQKYIIEQIDSILSQKGVEVFLVVRDDGSTDATLSVLLSYRQKYHAQMEVIAGLNEGVQRSFSYLINHVKDYDFDYFAFADQDDVWHEDKLCVAVSILKGKSADKPVLYFSNLCAVDEKLKPYGNIYAKGYVNITKKGALTRNFAYGCTCVFNRKAVLMYARNYEARMWMHDYWLYLICLYMGEVYYDENAYISYRQHGNNSVGFKRSIKQTVKRKFKSFSLLFTEHPREYMADDLYNTFKNELSKEDVRTIKEFINYRKTIITKLKASGDKGYLVYGTLQNLFLKIRFIIGSV